MVNLRLLCGNKSLKSVRLSFRIPYYTHWGQHLLVCGSEALLGSWNVKKGLLLRPSHQGDELIWSGSIPVPPEFKSEYSYYVVDDEKNVVRWEVGKKRKLLLPDGLEDGLLVELRDLWQTGSDDIPFKSAFKDVIFRRTWNLDVEMPLGGIQSKLDQEGRIILFHQSSLILFTYKYCKYGKDGAFSLEHGAYREFFIDFETSQPKYVILSDGMMREFPWRGAGVAIPMFSVRSEANVGVGEFLDLKLLVDWAVESGFHLVQLLPINDTSVHGMWWDSYPYSSLSVFALHPMYLRVDALSEDIPEDIKQEITQARVQLDRKVGRYIYIGARSHENHPSCENCELLIVHLVMPECALMDK
nr:4-alpha-glucanotransferase DPE2 [Ipomoea batatas]